MIEFALGLLVLAPLTAGLLRWTATAYVVYEMQEAVRRGATYAAGQPPAGYGNRDKEVDGRIRNVVLFGDASGSATVKIPGLKKENVQVSFGGVAAGLVTISIVGYEGPGGLVKLSKGPSASMPYPASGGG